MSFHPPHLILPFAALALTFVPPSPAIGQEGQAGPAEAPDSLTNPFAGAETWRLSNGLTVWFQRLPEDQDMYASVVIPYGSDQDFRGKEEIAHFLEHMLFSDHLGRTEEEIRREIEDLGGNRNGLTYPDRTVYYVNIRKEHGFTALEWLYRIVSPHEMNPEVVERQRQPVALEIGARPREFFDWVEDYVIDPPWLRVEGFWEREFGLETRPYRWYDAHTSLQAITPEDLRAFYDTYYVPSEMTLVVVGDLAPDSARARIEATFGTLPERPAPEVNRTLEDPGRYRASYAWFFRPNVLYDTRFKIYELTPEEHLEALFIEDILEERLKKRLRFGERKAVYGVSVFLNHRGPAAHLRISARIDDEEFPYARRVIEEEIEHLRRGSYPPEVFEELRESLVRQLARWHSDSRMLGRLADYRLVDRAPHEGLPDLVRFYRETSQEELADYARELFAREDRVHHVIYRQPVSQGVMLLAAVLLVALTVYLARKALTRPVEMPEIRYVARFKRSFVGRALRLLFFILLMALLYRVGAQGVYAAWIGVISPIHSYMVQHLFFAGVLALGVLGIVALLAFIPSKLLVFDDHLLIKYRAYRSRRIELEDIRSLTEERLGGFLRAGGPLSFRTFTLPVLRAGILLETATGRGYFFRVRDPEELIRTVEGLSERSP